MLKESSEESIMDLQLKEKKSKQSKIKNEGPRGAKSLERYKSRKKWGFKGDP